MKTITMNQSTKVPGLSLHRSVIAALVLAGVIALILITPRPASADWPPFNFDMSPSHENGRITYHLKFSNDMEWIMTDVLIKVPIPAGTGFVEAGADPSTTVNFDGVEVSFFTSLVNKPLKDMYFTLDITDPGKTVFDTHAWITWKGLEPGEYLTDDDSFDITRPELQWEEPARSMVQVDAKAMVAGDLITYTVYAASVTGQRIWDFKVNVPIPEGAVFVSATAPPTYTTNFDGREVSFSTLELPAEGNPVPLTFEATTGAAAGPLVVTHAWATWKNVGRNVGESVPMESNNRTGDIFVQPGTNAEVISDPIGDVPFPNYDVTSLAFQPDGAGLRVTFYTTAEVGPRDKPLQYFLYLDTDCQVSTGKLQRGRGVEYRIRYRHDDGQADVSHWEEVQAADGTSQGDWNRDRTIEVAAQVEGQTVTLLLPAELLGNTGTICWLAEARYNTKEFARKPRLDRIPDKDNLDLTEYHIPAAATGKTE